MGKFFKALSLLIRSERGATAVEYAMIVGLVAAVAVGTVTTLGTRVNNMFSSISNGINK